MQRIPILTPLFFVLAASSIGSPASAAPGDPIPDVDICEDCSSEEICEVPPPPPPPPPPANPDQFPSGAICRPPEFNGGQSPQCADVAGEAAWWGFDDYPLGTAEDYSSYGNDGTHVGSGLTASLGWVNGSLFFDGNGYVEVPDAPVIRGNSWDLSFEAWIQTDDDSGVSVILDKRLTSPPYTGYHLFLYNGRLSLQLANSSGYTNYISDAFIADGGMHHFAITVDRNHSQGIRWYIDGVEAGTRKNPTGRQGSLANTQPLRIGTRNGIASNSFRGYLDELALYRRSLSAAEVYELYAAAWFGRCDHP